MNTDTLEKTIFCMLPRKLHRNFLGVYAMDQISPLKTKCKKNCFLIVNLQNSYEPGSHWIVIGRCKNGNPVLFDSLHLGWVSSEIETFFKQQPCQEPKVQWQSSFSNVCGYYCILYIVCRLIKGWGVNQIQRNYNFHKQTVNYNDYVVINVVKPFVKYCQSHSTSQCSHCVINY